MMDYTWKQARADEFRVPPTRYASIMLLVDAFLDSCRPVSWKLSPEAEARFQANMGALKKQLARMEHPHPWRDDKPWRG